MIEGSCLCGTVAFAIRGDMRGVLACHCTQCRKQTGHYFAATQTERSNLTFRSGESDVRWYRASGYASRGFCQRCGSTLFWQMDDATEISVAAGSLEGDHGLSLERHIFCADKGTYYDINDPLPRHAATHRTVT